VPLGEDVTFLLFEILDGTGSRRAAIHGGDRPITEPEIDRPRQTKGVDWMRRTTPTRAIVANDCIMHPAAHGDGAMRNKWMVLALTLLGLTLATMEPGVLHAQASRGPSDSISILRRDHPEKHDLLVRLERVHGVLFGALAAEGETVRASDEKLPSPDFEFDMLDRLIPLVHERGTLDELADEAEAGYAALGERAAEVIRWTNGFRHEVFGILADTSITQYAARRAALGEAVERYRSRPEVALPSAPKSMDVLYTHPFAMDFRTGYADLGGLIWAGYWFMLAATEPLTDLRGQERLAGIDTVQTRYFAKLTYGEPPDYFPSELPMPPTIAVGFSSLSPEAAAIWDNLGMMQEVISDILASPEVTEVRAAIDAAVDYFLDPTVAMTNEHEWRVMALRHGIFFQGGPPIAVMKKSELNAGGHAAHMRGGGGAGIIMPGM